VAIWNEREKIVVEYVKMGMTRNKKNKRLAQNPHWTVESWRTDYCRNLRCQNHEERRKFFVMLDLSHQCVIT
jgi:hypothetical protein